MPCCIGVTDPDKCSFFPVCIPKGKINLTAIKINAKPEFDFVLGEMV